jgi:O-antigen/teichoic acid export membrane protein
VTDDASPRDSTDMPAASGSWVRSWGKDTALVLLSQASVTVMTSAISILLARSLDPADFGALSAFLSLSQALSLAVDVGLTTWLLRELSAVRASQSPAAADDATASLLRGSLQVNAVLGILLCALTGLVAAAAGLRAQLVALLVGLMLYVVLIAMSTALEAGLRSQRRLRLVVVTNIAEKATLAGGVVIVVVIGAPYAWLAVAYVVAGLTRVVLGHSFVLRPLGSGVRATRFSVIARSGAPFALNATAFNFVPRLDIPLVALFSTSSAAYFALGFQIFTTLTLIPVIGGSTLYPFAARLLHASSFRRVAAAFGVVGIAVAAVAIGLTPLLLPLIFGDNYQPAVAVTQVTLIALPLVFVGNGLMVGVYATHRERALLRRTLPGAVAGSIAVCVGQVLFGATGAAAGFVFRYVLFVGALLVTERGAQAGGEGQADRGHPAPS